MEGEGIYFKKVDRAMYRKLKALAAQNGLPVYEVLNDAIAAYLRYTMSQQMNPQMQLRLFQSGPGTLWTNMGNKNMNLFMPVPGAETKAGPEKPKGDS